MSGLQALRDIYRIKVGTYTTISQHNGNKSGWKKYVKMTCGILRLGKLEYITEKEMPWVLKSDAG